MLPLWDTLERQISHSSTDTVGWCAPSERSCCLRCSGLFYQTLIHLTEWPCMTFVYQAALDKISVHPWLLKYQACLVEQHKQDDNTDATNQGRDAVQLNKICCRQIYREDSAPCIKWRCMVPGLCWAGESCAVNLPVVPNLPCKLKMPSGSGHYSAMSPYCTTCWSPETRRRPLDWMCRMTSSWADKKEVCETWSPWRIACGDRRMTNPKDIKARWLRCADRKQEDVAHNCINAVHTVHNRWAQQVMRLGWASVSEMLMQDTWQCVCKHQNLPPRCSPDSVSESRCLSWGLWTLSHEYDTSNEQQHSELRVQANKVLYNSHNCELMYYQTALLNPTHTTDSRKL